MSTKYMKRMMLVIGLLGTLFLVILFSVGMNCYQASSCPNIPSFLFGVIDNDFVNNDMFQLIFLTPPLLLLSLLTYRMKDEVFRAWWSFAKWWVPVIIGVTLLLENAGGGGTLGMNKDFTILILGLLYTIFIINSLVKITKTHLALKWAAQGVSGDKLKEFKHQSNKKILWTVVIVLTIWFVAGLLV